MPDDGAGHALQEVRLARARSRSVFICTPIARHPVRQYTSSLLRSVIRLTELGIRAYVQNVVGSSNLPRARNELVAAFLASDYTDLLFVDDDMGWEPNAIVRLLGSEQAMIGAVGCKKVERPDTHAAKWCVRVRDGALHQDAMGAIEVRGIGTGFVRIAREVFVTLADAHPDWKRNGWPNMPEAARRWYYRFFVFPDDPDETGEDFHFCDQWRALGGTVWADPTIRLTHVGEKEFSGDFEALLEAAPWETQNEAGGDDAAAAALAGG